MSIVIKQARSVFVRRDNFQIVSEGRAKELPQDMRLRRYGINIFIYSDIDLSNFYTKHVRREVTGTYTVLVKNEADIPDISEVRDLIENLLLRGRIDWTTGTMFVLIPSPFSSRIWSSANGFVSVKTSQRILFRDIKRVSTKEFPQLKRELNSNNYSNLISIQQESVSENSEYAVVSVVFIGKILVV